MGQYIALILNNSVTVSILIAVLLVFRVLCKKISRRMICFLWILAAIKLIVPIQIESPLGMLPDYALVPVSTSVEETLTDTANTEKVTYPVGEGQTVHPQETDGDSALQQPEGAISGMITEVQNYIQKRIWTKPWMWSKRNSAPGTSANCTVSNIHQMRLHQKKI